MPARNFIGAMARDGLLQRLEPIVIDANTVLDLGDSTRRVRRLLKRRFRGARVECADGLGAIPFDDGTVDVVVANLLLPLIDSPEPLFAEVARVLRKEGLFAFSAFGPDTLPQLNFPDMHDIGDAAVRCGLRDPVLDVDRATLSYENAGTLQQDFADLGLEITVADERLPLSLQLEIVYGHCWGPGPRARDGTVRIDPAEITRR